MKQPIAKKRVAWRAWSAFLAGIMLFTASCFSGISIARAAEEESVAVKLHYHRDDGSYDGWDVYCWGTGRSDGGCAFTEEDEDGGAVATIAVTPGAEQIGYIIRYGGDSWEGKDVDSDRFITIPEVVSGTIHIYVESGVFEHTTEYGEDAVIVHRPSKASFSETDNSITVIMTSALDGDPAAVFQITGPDDGKIAIDNAEQISEREYVLKLAEKLDPSKDYRIIFDGNEYAIKMPNIYSTENFEAAYTYAGDDLGATWTTDKTTFRVWAPTAKSVTVNLYKSGTEGTEDLIERLTMTADTNGTWVAEKAGDLNGTYYTYTAEVSGQTNETVDPYARTTGVNGKRAMVIDLASTNPTGWESDANPNADLAYTDAVIYELHVRDLSSDESSGITNTGKFLGLTETGTTTSDGISTGLDHIKDLGVTHIHLLPVYDYGSVDETRLDEDQFNWGYDPVNYNVPEGSYSTDPYNGEVRVREMKQMVQTLHKNGLSVIMDVVYNHVQDAASFSVNQLVPGYFSRINDDGAYSNGSGCGNDTASERSMVRKFIVDSVVYWADEYHIDGFRFDLVGLIDTTTINEIVEEVHKKHPDVIFYGEGWSMDTDLTKENVTMATQVNSTGTPGFAYFSDTIRDALKGSVFDQGPGFVSGASGQEDLIAQCFTGLTSWCTTPVQTVNYASCHDNNTLFDRIALSVPDASRADMIRMNNLAAAIYLTSEGIPFMQAGEEMLRSKPKADGGFEHNSYMSPDSVNSLKWSDLENEEYQNVYDYYKGLIAFRKAHGALRLTNAGDVKANVFAVDGLPSNVVAFRINGGVNGETSDGLFLIFNANNTAQEITLPAGTWNVYINGEKAGTNVLETVTDGTVTAAPISATVLVKASGDSTWANPFADVSKSDRFYDGVAFVAENGLMTGVSTRLFAPNDIVTRGQLAAILYRLEGEPAAPKTAFSDVPAGVYYADAAAWAVANAIMSSEDVGRFAPNDAITYAQMVDALYRYAGFKGYEVAASDAISWAEQAGIISDVNDAQDNAVRAQAAAILMRFCENYVK